MMIGPTDEFMVAVPQASVAVAFPAGGIPEGLHPRFAPAGHDVKEGGVLSTVQEKAWVQVAVFPQPSVAV